jgi:hypothetical protein
LSDRSRALSSLVVAGAILSSVACGDTGAVIAGASGAAGGPQQGGSAGAGGASGGSTQVGTPLVWNADGFVATESNPFAIQGPFYSYSDCDPPSGLPCTTPDSSLTGADGKPGWSVDATAVCIKGTAVKVEGMSFAAQWGAGLALDLNSKGGEPGKPAEKGTFDLEKSGIRGFSVDISGTAPARIRINLTMPGVEDSSFVDAMVPGSTSFQIDDAKQGNWVTNKVPLDPSKVEALQFQVFTNAASPTPYDFCVKAIRVLSDAAPVGIAGSASGN